MVDRRSRKRVEALASAKYYCLRFARVRAIPLWQNQECREARQDSRVDRAEAASFTEQAIHAIPVLTLPCVGELYYIFR